MRTAPASKLSILITGCVAALFVVLIIVGVAKYGLSWQVHERFWSDIFGRVHGPLTFRFYLQPFMALIAALHDGVRDARGEHNAFFWSALLNPSLKRGRLREGMIATSRIALLGFGMDAIYQMKQFDRFYPVESVLMVLLLAVIPYFVFRWIIEHIAHWRLARKRHHDEVSGSAP